MGEFFMQVCEHHGMPLPKKCLFRNMQLVEFLYTPVGFHSKVDFLKLLGYELITVVKSS